VSSAQLKALRPSPTEKLAYFLKHADVGLRCLLGDERHVAPVRRNINIANRHADPGCNDEGNLNRKAGETMPIPLDLPQYAAQICYRFEKVKIILRAARVPGEPATKDLVRWIPEVRNPKPRLGIVLLNWKHAVGDRVAVGRPAKKTAR